MFVSGQNISVLASLNLTPKLCCFKIGYVHYNKNYHLSNMNFYFVLTIVLLVAVTCEECRKVAVDLDVRLNSEESLTEQIAILKPTLCPQVCSNIIKLF